MSGLESFTKKERKNVLSSIFGGGSSDEDSELSSNEEEEAEQIDKPDTTTAEEESDPTQDHISYFTSKHCNELQVAYHERKVLGIAHQLWPAASLLTDFLLANPQYLTMQQDKDHLDIIELGAGLGLTSIYLAACFNRVESTPKSRCFVCTDIAEAIPGIVENIALNHSLLQQTSLDSNVIHGVELFWGQDAHIHDIMSTYFPYCQRKTTQLNHHTSNNNNDDNNNSTTQTAPLILAADVVYWENLFSPLCQVLEVLCHEYGCQVIIAHVKRWKKDSKFFASLKKKGLQVDTLAEDVFMQEEENTGEMRKHIQRIYQIHAASKTPK